MRAMFLILTLWRSVLAVPDLVPQQNLTNLEITTKVLELSNTCLPLNLVTENFETAGTWLIANTISYFQYQKESLSPTDFNDFCQTTNLSITDYMSKSKSFYCDQEQFVSECGESLLTNLELESMEFLDSENLHYRQ